MTIRVDRTRICSYINSKEYKSLGLGVLSLPQTLAPCRHFLSRAYYFPYIRRFHRNSSIPQLPLIFWLIEKKLVTMRVITIFFLWDTNVQFSKHRSIFPKKKQISSKKTGSFPFYFVNFFPIYFFDQFGLLLDSWDGFNWHGITCTYAHASASIAIHRACLSFHLILLFSCAVSFSRVHNSHISSPVAVHGPLSIVQ